MNFQKSLTAVIALLSMTVMVLLSGCTAVHPDNAMPTPQTSPNEIVSAPGDTFCIPQTSPNEIVSTPDDEFYTPQYPDWVISSEGANYVILQRFDMQDFIFLLINNDSEIVHYHSYYKDSIIEKENGIILLEYNYGTMGSGHLYYDPETDRLSEEFDGGAVIAQDYGLIAYIDWKYDSKTGLLTNKIVIRDLMDASAFHVEYYRPISDALKAGDAVKTAYFIDENSLYVTYYVGEHTMIRPPEDLETCTEVIQFRDPQTDKATP